MGNGAVVETSDKRILVLQRSYNVGEFPGHYVFPGGHPEVSSLKLAKRMLLDFIGCLTVGLKIVIMPVTLEVWYAISLLISASSYLNVPFSP